MTITVILIVFRITIAKIFFFILNLTKVYLKMTLNLIEKHTFNINDERNTDKCK
jgi:hypothetical protein